MDLIADIGATNSRCALLDDKGSIVKSESFANVDFTGVAGLLKIFLGHRRASDRPKRAALAIAAPILGDDVSMLNINWRFSQTELKRELELNRLIVINDFAAMAWALPNLTPADCEKVGGGTGITRSPMAVIGPGSGLGVSSLVPSSDGWTAISGEGGHVTLAPCDDEEAEVVTAVRDEFGHCSAERLLSGPGLVRLYLTLAKMAGRESRPVTAADVTGLAEQGEPLAQKARGMFFSMLGTVASDLALIVGARGGVYVAGGIVPRMPSAFARSNFRARFEAKGRYRSYLESIPSFVVTAPMPALRGLRAVLGYR